MQDFLRIIKQNMEDYIESVFFQTIETTWKNSEKSIYEKLTDNGNKIIEDSKAKALLTISPNHNQFMADKKKLTDMKSKLSQFRVPTF